MKKNYYLLSVILLMFTTNVQSQTLQTIPFVDLKKYAGKWYEIASFPQRFQKNCSHTTAEYTVTDKGYIAVENKCLRDSIKGLESSIKGKAFIVENSGNAKLEIQFFWPFKGKYWIIELGQDYSYAVVGHPNKKYLWILSRTTQMQETLFQSILNKVSQQGFDISKINLTKQN